MCREKPHRLKPCRRVKVLEQTYKHDHATILKLNCFKKKKKLNLQWEKFTAEDPRHPRVYQVPSPFKKENKITHMYLSYLSFSNELSQFINAQIFLLWHSNRPARNDGQHFLDQLGNLICVEAVNLIHTAFLLLAGCSSGRKEWKELLGMTTVLNIKLV